MRHNHLGHEITVTSYEVMPGRWDLHVCVIWDNGQTSKVMFKMPQLFDIHDHAVAHGFLWVKTWIDAGKPNLSSIVWPADPSNESAE